MICLYPIRLKSGQRVPCGRCAACLQKQVRDTEFRLKEECKSETSLLSGFLTLTYNDEHIPKDGVSRRDVQLFHKRLRKAGYQFKYKLISEYGPTTHRPHYHGLYFFSRFGKTRQKIKDISDLEDELCRIWSLGNITFDEVLEERITYIANYHVTKGLYPAGKNPNFSVSSHNLGIACLTSSYLQWIRQNSTSSRQGFRASIPRYLRQKAILTEVEKERIQEKSDPNYFYEVNQEIVDNWSRVMWWQRKVKQKIINKKNKI